MMGTLACKLANLTTCCTGCCDKHVALSRPYQPPGM